MKKAVVLINIGSPNTVSISDVRKYLRKFLMDKRVIDIPFLSRYFLVNGIIAPFRASKSTAAYKKTLIDNKMPLTYYSEKLELKLQLLMGNNYIIKTAMMYGNPYVKDVLQKLQKENLEEIIIIPLYPQYASSTTGSAIENVLKEIKTWQVIPNIKITHSFFSHPSFIKAWAEQIKKYIPKNYDHVLFSYHGLPERQIIKAAKQFNHSLCTLDNCCNTINEKNYFCYRANCFETTRLVAEELKLDKTKYTIAFQSRLGKEEWLKPYMSDIIKELPKKEIKNLVIVSPAFVTDCLETTYEIGIEYNYLFKKFNGENLTLIPSLNDNDDWCNFLKTLIIS